MDTSVIGSHFLYGIRIFTNPLCLRTTETPCRPYRRRRWQTAAQFTRKRKKWIKRFGFVKEPCMYKAQVPSLFGRPTQEAYFVHPSLLPQIEEALGREKIIQHYRQSPLLGVCAI